jgi:hypothetical protein
MNDAHLAHSEAINLRDQSQQALRNAEQHLEASHDHLRQMLSGTVLDATMLQYQYLHNVHSQQQVMACDKQHTEREQHAEQTQQQLLDAKVRTETYLRLNERREQVMEQTNFRQQQRISDESGVVRAATACSQFLSITGEKPHGN